MIAGYPAGSTPASITVGPGRASASASAAASSRSLLTAALTDALARPGPTVIDAHVDPAGYPAVMDLSRGQAGRRSVPGISRANQVTQVKERVQ